MPRLFPALLAALLVLLCPAATRAQAVGSDAPAPEVPADPRPTRVLALLGVTVNTAAQGQGDPVEALLASHLAEGQGLRVVSRADLATLLDVERQKQLLGMGCEEACATELAGAVGADLVIVSRLDRFGEGYVLTASLIDVPRSLSLAKPRAEATGEDALPQATRDLAAQLLAALGAAPAAKDLTGGAAAEAVDSRRLVMSLKVGNTLLTGLASFNLAGDLQLGYQISPEWVGFLQVGLTLVQKGRLEIENVALVPSLLGIRHLYRVDERFQPYWGLGLGVQLNLNSRFKFVASNGVLPAVYGMGGFQYFLSRRFALGLDASLNLAGTVVELTTREELRALNVSFQGVLAWRL
jgi:hypothetical protein